MSKSVEVISYAHGVKKATEEAMKKAARMIGGSISGHAAEAAPVRTGLLKNSITFALGGEAPAITDYHADIPDKNGKLAEGHYSGTAPEDDAGAVTVHVGTNVEYGPYQELGAPNINLEARPYLRPAFENNEREILQIIEKTMGEL